MHHSVELVTIYLVDLVGSTRLASALGPSRADRLRAEYFALLRGTLTASGGKEFKSTGDGLLATFPSASAAICCAIRTQQRFARYRRDADPQLHVRIGVASGEATVQQGDYFGMPTIEAARLCDRAPADGIFVSAATRSLAGRVDGARFESVGALQLKGFPEPMETFAVNWEPRAEYAASAFVRDQAHGGADQVPRFTDAAKGCGGSVVARAGAHPLASRRGDEPRRERLHPDLERSELA
jgi:class 3 adenylate cyclase